MWADTRDHSIGEVVVCANAKLADRPVDRLIPILPFFVRGASSGTLTFSSRSTCHDTPFRAFPGPTPISGGVDAGTPDKRRTNWSAASRGGGSSGPLLLLQRRGDSDAPQHAHEHAHARAYAHVHMLRFMLKPAHIRSASACSYAINGWPCSSKPHQVTV